MSEVQEHVASRIDLPYVELVGGAIAEAIRKNEPIEANFQPGDGTAYRLLFTPIVDLTVAPPRKTESIGEWDARCPFGVARKPGAAVVSWIGNGSEGLDFSIGGGFHGDYINGLFGRRSEASGWALATLFDAIAVALDARPTSCPRPGEIPAFDAGWDAHEIGLERATVEAVTPPGGRSFALLAWDIREKIYPTPVAGSAEERTERNHVQRHAIDDNAIDGAIRMLLDGLEVDSIRTLKTIVDSARSIPAA